MENIEKLDGTTEIDFDQEKAELNVMENRFNEDDEGEGEDAKD